MAHGLLARYIQKIGDERRLRIKHALRVVIGAAILHLLAVQTPITAGCSAPIFYYVSTIAGTTESYEGFQLRSAALTLWGVLCATTSFAIIFAIAAKQAVAVYFVTLPFIAFFILLRTDASIAPLPAVAAMYTGFLVISNLENGRDQVARIVAVAVSDGLLAFAVAVSVNVLLFPDRASTRGRQLIADVLRNLGAAISSSASHVLSVCPQIPDKRFDFSLQSRHQSIQFEDLPYDVDKAARLIARDSTAASADLQRHLSRTGQPDLVRKGYQESQRTAALYNRMVQVRPLGKTQLENYQTLCRAQDLLQVSSCEPTLVPGAALRWRNHAVWLDIANGVQSLIHKVASMESASSSADGSGPLFSAEETKRIFGEAFFPIWKSHFASCAAACAVMSCHMRDDTCNDMFYIAPVTRENVRQSILPVITRSRRRDNTRPGRVLHADIDPRRWTRRRAEMYLALLLRYRSKWCDFVERRWGPLGSTQRPASQSRINHASSSVFGREELRSPRHLQGENDNFTEPQALVFFAISSHALSEEIARVQRSMAELAQSRSRRSLKALLTFAFMPAQRLWLRCQKIYHGELQSWEVRFIAAHGLLLFSLIALSLFLPIRKTFEASEIGWVYTSAVLSTQLSVEPTLFVGLIRVFATASGAALAYAADSVLKAIGRESNNSLQYLLVPYLMIIGFSTLLLFSPRFRYAAFLTVLTASLVAFCPQTSKSCTRAFVPRPVACYPTWKFAVARASNVSVGVLFAIVFHLLFWPRFAHKEIRSLLSKSFLRASGLFARQHRVYFRYGERLEDDDSSIQLAKRQRSVYDGLPPNLNDRERLYWTLGVADVYKSLESQGSKQIQREVDSPLQAALAMVAKDAAVWKFGPMSLSPRFQSVCFDFIALSVSLHEMASLLSRRPVLSGSYGSSAFEKYIAPCIYQYETVQISLSNLVGAATRTLEKKSHKELQDAYLDLLRGLRHLAESREELHHAIRTRSIRPGEGACIGNLRRCHSDDSAVTGLRVRDDDLMRSIKARNSGAPTVPIRRSVSFDDNILSLHTQGHKHQQLRPDDAVLFVAFSFASSGCLNAFARIARDVIQEVEAVIHVPGKQTRNQTRKATRKPPWSGSSRIFSRRGVRILHRHDP